MIYQIVWRITRFIIGRAFARPVGYTTPPYVLLRPLPFLVIPIAARDPRPGSRVRRLKRSRGLAQGRSRLRRNRLRRRRLRRRRQRLLFRNLRERLLHLFLACPKLLEGFGVLAGHLMLVRLEVFDGSLRLREIARERLQL